ncbi:MAG: glycosyltransferase family 4 protein [bacterium]
MAELIPLRAYSAGVNSPAPRYRVFQFKAKFRDAGYDLIARHTPFGGYPPRARALRPLWGGASLLWRAAQMIETHRRGINFFQRELISTMATVEWMAGGPRVFDVDDAIWLLARGRGTDTIAAHADLVICGNSFLADHYRGVSQNVIIVPTAVDTSSYPETVRQTRDTLVIGWSGTSGGFKYLEGIQDALMSVLQALPAARLRILADRAPVLPRVPVDRLEFIKWTPQREASVISGFDVGIMPLSNTEWERGKCSFKMLQYMAARVPVVVSPIGMNQEVLSMGTVGLSASTEAEWVDAVIGVLTDRDAGLRMGRAGRAVVERFFSREVVGRQLVSALDGIRPA